MNRWMLCFSLVAMGYFFGGCGTENSSPTDPGDVPTDNDTASEDSVTGDASSPEDGGPQEVIETDDIEADAAEEVSVDPDVVISDVEDAGDDAEAADAEAGDADPGDAGEAADAVEEVVEPEEPAIPLDQCLQESCPDEYAACDEVPGCSSVVFCMNICEAEHTPHCGDDECGDDEDHLSCAQDCPAPYCGDWQCNGDEDVESCAQDCYEPVCGDGLCEGFESWFCDEDCETECGNDVCETWEENYVECPDDCDAPVCGNGFCQEDDGEDYTNCLDDCPAPVCGDGDCNGDETEETCADDCQGGGGFGGGGGGGGFGGGGGGGFFGGGFGGGGGDDEEPWVEEMHGCFESCMLSAGGANPVPTWGSLETCADEAGCIDLGAITGEEEEGGMMGGMMGGGMMGGGGPECGNGVCQFEDGEDAATCPDDCEGVEPPECSDTDPCDEPAFCESGSCTCPDEYFCDNECVDIQSHPLHCGECGNLVPAGGTCDGGYATCPGDELICGETCADLNTHSEHCGSCFEACVAGAICIDGGCKGTPPRPVAPLSGVTVSSRRPLFQVELPPAGDATQITICSDRICQDTITVFTVVGSSGKPPEDLPSGSLFWYSQTKAAGLAGQETSTVWSFYVPHSNAPVDSAWGASMDFNQDGFSDVAIGSCGTDGCTSSAFVHYSNPDGGISATPDSEISEPAGGSGGFGAAVTSAGDTDGNGYPELLLGTSSDGLVYHYGNSNGGLSPGPSTSWTMPAGVPSMASAGDVNRDGYGDIIASGTTGTSFFVGLGGPQGVDTLDPFDLPAGEPGDAEIDGLTVRAAGDVNGDGLSDVLVGVPSRGSAFVYQGTPVGLAPLPGTTMEGTGEFGASVATAGDVNADGYTDLIVGAPGAEGGGEAYVFLGSPQGVDYAPDISLSSPGLTAFGSLVSTAGDVNGDGFSDVMVSSEEGVQVLMGAADNPLAGDGIIIYTPTVASSATFADSIGFSRDLDGDGTADLLIGAPSVGKVYLYSGGDTGPDPASPSLTLEGVETIPGYGSTLALLKIRSTLPSPLFLGEGQR